MSYAYAKAHRANNSQPTISENKNNNRHELILTDSDRHARYPYKDAPDEPVTDPRHVLSRLLPEVKSTSYNLRPRAHCFVLPTKDTRNFIPRMLLRRYIAGDASA